MPCGRKFKIGIENSKSWDGAKKGEGRCRSWLELISKEGFDISHGKHTLWVEEKIEEIEHFSMRKYLA